MFRFARVIGLLACAFVTATAHDPVSDAIAALQRGDLSSAERILHSYIEDHPADAAALEVLGVVLDQEKKYSEADPVYRRALGLGRSPGLLNNYGNHLLSTGKVKEARQAFLAVLALDPTHANATIQLARIALEQKSPAQAISYLDRLPAEQRDSQDVAFLRMQADYAVGRMSEADAMLKRLSANDDPVQSFTLGKAVAAAGQYDKAEVFFERTVRAEPDNFAALYDLGLAAGHAGHNERARDALQKALEKQPDNPNVLYDLAATDVILHDRVTALALLARARHLAPNRPEIDLLLARTAGDLGYFGDAVETWDAYLKLIPNDEIARRERAFAQSATDENVEPALAELQSFVRHHPTDANGYYELAMAESPSNPDQALKDIERALALKPNLIPAHVTRGLLRYRQGKPEAALRDFEFAAQHEPTNAVILDRLGETYLALGRPGDAVPVLQRAEASDSKNPNVLLHLGRALSKTGRLEEAAAAFARYRDLGGANAALPHPPGLIDFLSLPPEEQQARYRAGVERTVASNPDSAAAEVEYLGLLLKDGKADEAQAVARKLISLKPDAALLGKAALVLIRSQRAAEALQLLDQASQGAMSDPQLATIKAIATDLTGQNSDTQFKEIETRWPKWDAGWIAHALVLLSRGQRGAAQHDFDNALALDTRNHAADYLAAYLSPSKKDQPQVVSPEVLLAGLPLLFP
ncbi:MAG: tetratricopeptide repeat protein [Acidobacteriaceae bacterium]|nr:tetratricopeptide repeat protein [Acidobacteriaceae bacterium]MBV9502174.1 tetratricopeptide repeat protein [Acidobacteriaceae bacterium]